MAKLKQQASDLAARAAADAAEAAQFRARAERDYSEVSLELEQQQQQASKLQALHTQTQAKLEAAEAATATLTSELAAAREDSERLRRDMRNLQAQVDATEKLLSSEKASGNALRQQTSSLTSELAGALLQDLCAWVAACLLPVCCCCKCTCHLLLLGVCRWHQKQPSASATLVINCALPCHAVLCRGWLCAMQVSSLSWPVQLQHLRLSVHLQLSSRSSWRRSSRSTLLQVWGGGGHAAARVAARQLTRQPQIYYLLL